MYIYTYTVYMTAYLHPGCRPANFSVPQHLEEEGGDFILLLSWATYGHLLPLTLQVPIAAVIPTRD